VVRSQRAFGDGRQRSLNSATAVRLCHAAICTKASRLLCAQAKPSAAEDEPCAAGELEGKAVVRIVQVGLEQ
jgi:hypothetical protein